MIGKSHIAIRNIYPAVATIYGDRDARDSNGNVVVLNESLITEEEARLQAEYDSEDYARNRKAEYPSIADQLDDIYHNGIDAWKATIKTTKDKYPKP